MKAELDIVLNRLCDEGMYDESLYVDCALDKMWALGILEGEGCLSMFDRKCSSGNVHPQFAIHCEMTDEDIVIRLYEALGRVGNINHRVNNRRKDNCERKPSWILSIQKQQEVFNTLTDIAPWLGVRRGEKALKILEALKTKGIAYVS